jgi:hypothetical protein
MAWELGARLHDLVQHKKRRGSIGGKFVCARLKQRPLLKKIFQSRKSGE